MENWYLTQWISVARGRWVWGGENQGRSQKRGNSLYFFHLWEWAVDHQTQQFMNLRAWMLGLCGGNHCLNGHREEWRRRIWDSVDRYLFPSMWYIFTWNFSKAGAVVFLFISWPSSQFFFLIVKGNSWWMSVITDAFQHLFLFYCPFQVTVHDCSPPLPPRPWRSIRMQGWPSPSGCPTSTTNSWRGSWTSQG